MTKEIFDSFSFAVYPINRNFVGFPHRQLFKGCKLQLAIFTLLAIVLNDEITIICSKYFPPPEHTNYDVNDNNNYEVDNSNGDDDDDDDEPEHDNDNDDDCQVGFEQNTGGSLAADWGENLSQSIRVPKVISINIIVIIAVIIIIIIIIIITFIIIIFRIFRIFTTIIMILINNVTMMMQLKKNCDGDDDDGDEHDGDDDELKCW